VTVDTTGGSGTFTDWLVSNVQNWVEGTVTTYSGTSLTVSVDVTSGTGTFADWLVYGFAWEQPVKALASGVHDGTYRFVPQIMSPSTATPLLPVEGNQWYQNDTNLLFIYDGAAWVQMAAISGWTAWTPTTSGLTLGTGGTITGAYNRVGKRVEFYLRIVLGTSPAYTATTTFSVPTGTPAMAPTVEIVGTRSSARWRWFPIVVSGSATVQLGYPAAGWATAATAGQLTGTMNVAGYATATANDVLDISGWYVTT
jgi:hypothetical protein